MPDLKNLSSISFSFVATIIFSIEVFVRVGSRDEDDITRGISHLLEHMLFKGTKKRPSYKEIKTEY